MSKHISKAPPQCSNFDAVGLGHLADVWGVTPAEARVLHRRMQHSTWIDAPVLSISPGVLPSAEDGIPKLHERHPDLVPSETAPERLGRQDQ